MVINGTVSGAIRRGQDVADMKRAVTVNVSVQKDGFRVRRWAPPFSQEEAGRNGAPDPLHGSQRLCQA